MRLLRADEVATILQVTRTRVYELARLGLIPCVRMGRQIRFNEAALKEWITCGGTAEKHKPRPDKA